MGQKPNFDLDKEYMNKVIDATALVTISAVERETGISKDTLRIWERRYGFPNPVRDSNGDRAYTPQDVERLRLIKRLIDHGMRPGKIVIQSLTQLAKTSSLYSPVPHAGSRHQKEIDNAIDMIRNNELNDLQTALHHSLLRHGLLTFITEIVTPLNAFIGSGWLSGDLKIFQEHAYTEILQNMLRHAIVSYEKDRSAPNVLLATLPREHHSIGLLMVEAMLTFEGAHCVSLGPQLPVMEIVAAAAAHQSDIIALSFTGNYPDKLISEGLTNLRAELPKAVEVWAGGSAIERSKRPFEGIKLLSSLDEAINEVVLWRQRHSFA
jgi:MerR family transcriptional regulator, light-induced transcriptional regulator